MYFYSPSSSSSTSSSSYAASPMDIPSSSSTASARARPQSPSCAYPSWPQGSSLSSSAGSSTSFIISDEELFPSVFDEAEQDCTPPVTPHSSRSPASPAMMCEPQLAMNHGSFMRELIAEDKARKERRRRRSSKKSRCGSAASKHMSPILEAGE